MINHDHIIIFFLCLFWSFLLFRIRAFRFCFFFDLSLCLNICWLVSLNHFFLSTHIFLLLFNMIISLLCLLFYIFPHNLLLFILNFLFFGFYLLLLNFNLFAFNFFFCLFWNLNFNILIINLLDFPLIKFFLFNFFNILIILTYLFFCFFFCFNCLLIFIWKFFFRYLLRILAVVYVNNFFRFFNCHFMGFFQLSSNSTHSIILRVLNEMIQNLSFWVISPMLNLILCDFCQPEVVFLGIGIKNIHRYIGFTHLLNNRSICTVSHVNCTVLGWIASNQGFSPLEGMNVVFKGCHHMVFVELWNPMEKSVQETRRIAIKCFTYTVNWHMVVDKLYFILVGFKRVNHELLLVSKITKNLTHQIHAYTQNQVPSNGHYRKWSWTWSFALREQGPFLWHDRRDFFRNVGGSKCGRRGLC